MPSPISGTAANLPWPSVVELSRAALEAGAVGITVHPRPDERHIRRSDVTDISRHAAQGLSGPRIQHRGLSGRALPKLVEEERPDQVTLVPDDPAQGTSDHGWDIAANRELLTGVIARLHRGGMRVSLFVDPDPGGAGAGEGRGGGPCRDLYRPLWRRLRGRRARREFDKVVATGKAAARRASASMPAMT